MNSRCSRQNRRKTRLTGALTGTRTSPAPVMAIEFERSFNPMSLAFVEGLYADYVKDPASVPIEWREYFESLGPDQDFLRAPRLGRASSPRRSSTRRR